MTAVCMFGQLHANKLVTAALLLIIYRLSTVVSTCCRLSTGQHAWQDKPQGFVPELERITKQVQSGLKP